MSKDPNGGGTNKDGSISLEYCSLCYANGAFTYTGEDVTAYQKMVVDEMVKKGWLRPTAWLFTRRIPKLKRWNKAS